MDDAARPTVTEGTRVLVVGASAGIGREVAIAAHRVGARVALAARSIDVLRELASDLGDERAVPVAMDVTSEESVREGVATAVGAWNGIDAVIYCAGITHLATLADTSASDWHRLLATNVVGAGLVAGAVLASLVESGGRLALVSSDSVASPMAGLVAYTVSKGAVEHLATSVAVEAPEVVVTRIVVGPTITSMAAGWDPELMASYLARWTEAGWFDGVEPQMPEVVAEAIVERWLTAEAPGPVIDLGHLARPSR